MKKTIILLFAAFLILAVSCSSTGSAPEAKAVTVKQANPELKDDSHQLYAKADGKTLTVELGGNPTTGYSWDAGSSSVVDLDDSSYESSGSSGMVGAGGVFKFVFKAVKAGKDSVLFKYERSWEGAAADSFFINVEVDENLTITNLVLL